MALRIYDPDNPQSFAYQPGPPGTPQNFATLYPGDYGPAPAGLPEAPDLTSQYALYNSPAQQRERTLAEMARPKRYEEIAPYNPGWWERTFFPTSDKLLYERKKQAFNQKIDDQARKDAILESNIMRSIEAAPPGKRDPQMKILQRYYQGKGVQMDPEIVKFYKQADAETFQAAKWAATELAKMHPDLNENELWKGLNSNPLLQVEFFGKIQEAQQTKLKNEQLAAENKIWESAGTAMAEPSVEAPSEPVAPSTPLQVPQAAPQAQVRPMANVGAQKVSPRGQAYNQMVDTIGARIGASPAAIEFVKTTAAIETDDYDYNAVSPRGAVGPQQFMPDTAKRYNVNDPRLPGEAIMGAFKYHADLEKLFPGRPDLQYAAYNAGEGRVQKAGNKVPDIPQTQQYVQKALARTSGVQKPHSESVAQAPAQVQEAVRAYDARINKIQSILDRIPPQAAAIPKLKGMIESLRTERDFLTKRQGEIEKRYDEAPSETLKTAATELYPGRPWSMLTPDEKQAAKLWADETAVTQEGRKAGARSKATLDDDLKKARAANMGNLISASEAGEYMNTQSDDPAEQHPVGMSKAELAAENAEARKATGKPKWVIAKKMDDKLYEESNVRADAIEAADKVLGRLQDPKVARLIGHMLSNPEGSLDKFLANTFGGKVPEEYRELAAELADLTSAVRRDRIGAAQTKTEFESLKPLLAGTEDVDLATVRAKIRTVRNSMVRSYNRVLRDQKSLGVRVPPTWKAYEEAVKETPAVEATPPATTSERPTGKEENPLARAAREYQEQRAKRRAK